MSTQVSKLLANDFDSQIEIAKKQDLRKLSKYKFEHDYSYLERQKRQELTRKKVLEELSKDSSLGESIARKINMIRDPETRPEGALQVVEGEIKGEIALSLDRALRVFRSEASKRNLNELINALESNPDEDGSLRSEVNDAILEYITENISLLNKMPVYVRRLFIGATLLDEESDAVEIIVQWSLALDNIIAAEPKIDLAKDFLEEGIKVIIPLLDEIPPNEKEYVKSKLCKAVYGRNLPVFNGLKNELRDPIYAFFMLLSEPCSSIDLEGGC